jgi:hypothetical protein
MGMFDFIFDDSSSSSSDSWLDSNEWNLTDTGDESWADSYSTSWSDSLFSSDDSSSWLSDSYNPGGINDWDSIYGDSAFDLSVDKDSSWLGKVGDFLGSSKGLGLIGGLGKAGLGYMTQDKLVKDQRSLAMEKMAKENEYAMAMLRLKDEITDGNRTSGGGGRDGGGGSGNNDAAIKALADKYPSNPNFKRAI